MKTKEVIEQCLRLTGCDSYTIESNANWNGRYLLSVSLIRRGVRVTGCSWAYEVDYDIMWEEILGSCISSIKNFKLDA